MSKPDYNQNLNIITECLMQPDSDPKCCSFTTFPETHLYYVSSTIRALQHSQLWWVHTELAMDHKQALYYHKYIQGGPKR